ncbi:MAG: amino acid ABC transporter permease [Azospirillaceae bacterium]|nr:amino acid ABC transporter permease [Azospirillaceae bacterium]
MDRAKPSALRTPAAQIPVAPRRARNGGSGWWRGLFDTPANAVITAACLLLLGIAIPPVLRWTVLDAVWSGTSETCRSASGACWAFIGEKFRFILFGFYPRQQHWKPALTLVLLFGMIGVTAVPRFWHPRLVVLWVVAIIAAVLLMAGAPHPGTVATDVWAGLPLTLLLAVIGIGAAFPLALLLALGRRSRMGGVRWMSILVIEVMRGVPLIAVLYAAILLLPLMLPAGVTLDKLLRAQLALAGFIAAYMAEVIRAGLQGVGDGQYEAAKSLGLSYGTMLRLVILPQALRIVIPSFVTLAIGVLQSTTLVIVIGAFDFLNTARVAASDPNWLGFFDEAFFFTGAVYFLLSFLASRYSLWLERRLRR